MDKEKICYITFRRADIPKPFLYNLDEDINVNDLVVAEGDRGVTIAKVIKIVNKDDIHPGILKNIKTIIRKATEEDKRQYRENKKEAIKAKEICFEKVIKHKLQMKLIKAEYMLDKKKLVFYFTADGRVDFRELVKDLAKEFKVRIEMRQIGVRDESKMVGCIGNCGMEACCARFLYTFQPISVKTAKDQNIVLNPSKISGVCGRLMCCLAFEHELYLEKIEESKVDLSKFEEEINEEELKKLED